MSSHSCLQRSRSFQSCISYDSFPGMAHNNQHTFIRFVLQILTIDIYVHLVHIMLVIRSDSITKCLPIAKWDSIFLNINVCNTSKSMDNQSFTGSYLVYESKLPSRTYSLVFPHRRDFLKC